MAWRFHHRTCWHGDARRGAKQPVHSHAQYNTAKINAQNTARQNSCSTQTNKVRRSVFLTSSPTYGMHVGQSRTQDARPNKKSSKQPRVQIIGSASFDLLASPMTLSRHHGHTSTRTWLEGKSGSPALNAVAIDCRSAATCSSSLKSTERSRALLPPDMPAWLCV